MHNRIIERLKEPLKTAVRWASLLHDFNLDILTAVLPTDENGHPLRLSADQFAQLMGYSFVIRTAAGWNWHHLVLQAQSIYLRQAQPEAFRAFHQRAADYFDQKVEQESLYHRFFCDPARAFEEWRRLEEMAARQYDRGQQARLFDLAERREIVLENAHKAYIFYRRGDFFITPALKQQCGSATSRRWRSTGR